MLSICSFDAPLPLGGDPLGKFFLKKKKNSLPLFLVKPFPAYRQAGISLKNHRGRRFPS
jgi:hypothetical protein